MADSPLTSVEGLKVGDFIKYIGRDERGRYTYTGEVTFVQNQTKSQPAMFEMLTFDGTMGFTFPRTDVEPHKKEEIEFEVFPTKTKPPGWAKFKKNPDGYRDAKQEEEKVVVAKPKKQQVFELVAANPRKKEAALLKLAKKEIGGSDATLRNYIRLALAKK